MKNWSVKIWNILKRTPGQISKYGVKSGLMVWRVTKRVWGAIRAFGSYAWPHFKKAGQAVAKKIATNKLVLAIRANKFVIPVFFGIVALSAVIAWQLSTAISEFKFSFPSTPSIPSHYWWWGLGVVVVFATWLALRKTNWQRLGQMTGSIDIAPVFWPVAGLGVFHWLFWATAPEAWNAWYAHASFWPMNVAALALGVIASQKGPIRYIGYAIGILLFFSAVNGLGGHLAEKGFFERRPTATTPRGSVIPIGVGLTADLALPIIAECESGGRQFDDEGNLVTNPKSAAVGKYQIMSSLHEERAKSFGYNIRTLEGNEGYARLLFAEEGTRPWEESRGCWEPKLLALGAFSPSGTSRFLVKARRDGWTEAISVPLGGKINWEREGNLAGYQTKISPSGNVYALPKGPAKAYLDIKERIQAVSFRIDPEDEAEEISIRVAITR